jgi:hypothetical protein
MESGVQKEPKVPRFLVGLAQDAFHHRGGSRGTSFPPSPSSTGGDNGNGLAMVMARPWQARSVCVGAVGVLDPSVAQQGQRWRARVHEAR